MNPIWTVIEPKPGLRFSVPAKRPGMERAAYQPRSVPWEQEPGDGWQWPLCPVCREVPLHLLSGPDPIFDGETMHFACDVCGWDDEGHGLRDELRDSLRALEGMER